MMIQLKDKKFERYISEKEINTITSEIARALEPLKSENPHFIIVLKGSFLFAAAVLQKISYDAQISFVQLKSYQGTKSTGNVTELIGLNESITNKTVVILEDIVDSGLTLEKLYEILKAKNPNKIQIATMLFKPDCYKKTIPIDYIGKKINNEFVVGYGLDYQELGRTLPAIFKLIK